MSRIQYPMTTAAVFDDIVYPVSFNGPESIRKEIDGAVNWFCRWCNEERAVVRSKMLVSCWGAYLNHDQVMSEAA
ncbi:protein ninY [Cronobacter sakazakii]|nr:protein ninY [Cronobacter sakazakii]